MAFITPVPLSQTSLCASFATCTLPRKPLHPSLLSLRASLESPPVVTSPKPPSIQRYFHTFTWHGHEINYLVQGPTSAPPILLIHGFGASINHWRKNIPSLATHFRVYAIDLLGFGASAKPAPDKVTYGISLWAHLVKDFVTAMSNDKWVLVGNSIGSLTALAAANQLGPDKVRALSLMNCAGGLVSFRYSELNFLQASLLRLFNFALFNSVTGPSLFSNFRKRSNIKNVLQQVYMDKSAVTDELVEILYQPSEDQGACQVFLAILNGDAGPTPESLLQQLSWCPILVVWGEKDPWTPLREGFHPGQNFPRYHPQIDLRVIDNAGHCLHDECPHLVNPILLHYLHALN